MCMPGYLFRPSAGEPRYDVYKLCLFLFKIPLIDNKKTFVSGGVFFQWFIVGKMRFEKRSQNSPYKHSWGGLQASRHFHRGGAMSKHLGYLHFSPQSCRVRCEL